MAGLNVLCNLLLIPVLSVVLLKGMQFSLVAQWCLALCNSMDCSMPGFHPSPTSGACSNSCPLSWWCHPTISSCLPLLFLPSFLPSIRVFSNDSFLQIRWPKYGSYSFSIRLSNEFPGLMSLRMYWLDLLAVQGTLKSLLKHHSSKASVLWCSTLWSNSHIRIWLLEKP